MNNRKKKILKYWFPIIFIFAWGLTIVSCSKKKANPSIKIDSLIQTVQVHRIDFNRIVTGYGYVKATRKRDIIAHTQSVIEQVWRKKGNKVAKGEKLFRLKGTCSNPKMVRIKTEMETAKAELNRQRREYSRIKAIEEENGSYEKEQNNVYTNYKIALENFKATKKNYDFYTKGVLIISPINGYVISRSKFPGNAVRAGELLASIIDLEKLICEINVFGTNINSVKIGQSAVVMSNKREFSGRVSFISMEINRDTGARKIGIDILQGKSIKLLPGDFVKAEIIVEKHLSSLAIPKEALLNGVRQKVVIVKVGQTYEKRDILIGLHNESYVEVLKGLNEGEEVVTVGAYELLNRGIAKKIKVED